ncbi:MAG TPA: glycosyltransferase [Candidatus Paceibacterota bacterium]
MRKILFLITHAYPYSPPSEQFLHNEIQYLSKAFDKVIMIPVSRTARTENVRDISFKNVSVIRLMRRNKFVEILNVLITKTLWQKNFYKDIVSLFKRQAVFNKSAVMQFLAYHTNSYIIFSKTLEILRTADYKDNITIYSYWLSELSYSAALLKNRMKKDGYKNVSMISRAHGPYDLFISKISKGFKPCLKYLTEHIDMIYSISNEGKEYLKSIGFTNTIKVSYLGVAKSNSINIIRAKSYPIHIVSCSYISPIKRIDKIVSALSKIDSIEVKWTHIGGGKLYDQIAEIAKRTLPSNIKWELKGVLKNQDILEYYKENSPDVFINVSSMEGIPVSIMEAISFGIPVIATDVGGTCEICVEGYNGYLLNKDFKGDDLVNAIMKIILMPKDQYQIMCQNSHSLFLGKFDQETNYLNFIKQILG